MTAPLSNRKFFAQNAKKLLKNLASCFFFFDLHVGLRKQDYLEPLRYKTMRQELINKKQNYEKTVND